MTGLEIFTKKCTEAGIKTDINRTELTLTYPNGKEIKYNTLFLAETYGTLAFIHLNPDEAMNEMVKDLTDSGELLKGMKETIHYKI